MTLTFADYFDGATLRHLDRWLERDIDGEDCRDAVKIAMLAYAADDPEYWSAQSWPNLFDHAKCDRIVTEHRS